jgi:hypothetical protein
MRQDFAQKVFGSFVLRVPEKFSGGRTLDQPAFIHEYDAMGHFLCEPHLMRDHDHGHPLMG